MIMEVRFLSCTDDEVDTQQKQVEEEDCKNKKLVKFRDVSKKFLLMISGWLSEYLVAKSMARKRMMVRPRDSPRQT